MASHDSLVGILRLLYAWRKKLLRAALAVGVLSAVVSLFLPDYYQSRTVFYAASTDVANPDGIFGPPGQAMEYFGSGADRDRILTIANSTVLLDRMIDSFGLMDRYKIKSDHPKARERARLKFSGYYKVMETKFDGIQIEMEDKDPRMAADMANAARMFIDQIALGYVQGSQRRLLATLDGSIREKQGYLDGLADSLSRVQQQTGVYDTREQGRYIGSMISHKSVELAGDRARLEMYRKIGYTNRDTIANITARIAGLETELADLTGATSGRGFDIARYNTGSGLVATLQQQYENTKNQLSYEIEKANHLRAVLDGEVSVIVPFEEALPPVSKHRPKRAVLVGTAVFLSLLFGALFVILWDSLRREWTREPGYAGH